MSFIPIFISVGGFILTIIGGLVAFTTHWTESKKDIEKLQGEVASYKAKMDTVTRSIEASLSAVREETARQGQAIDELIKNNSKADDMIRDTQAQLAGLQTQVAELSATMQAISGSVQRIEGKMG